MDNVSMSFQQAKIGFESAKNNVRKLLRNMEMAVEQDNFLGALIIAERDLDALSMNAAERKLEYDEAYMSMEIYQMMASEDKEATDKTADIQHKESE